VSGARSPADVAAVSSGLEWRLQNGLALYAKASGEFGAGTAIYSGTGGVRAVW
jgi:hypothetical protein